MSDSMNTVLTPPKKPGVVIAIGVITIVFCSLGILSVLYTIIGSLVLGGPAQLMQQYRGLYANGLQTGGLYDDVFRITAKYAPVTMVFNVVALVIAGLGLAGGILILKPRPASLPLLRAYAIIDLVSVAVSLVWSVLLLSEIQGAMSHFVTSMDMPRGMDNVTNGIIQFAMYLGIVLGAVFGFAWPVILLALCQLKKVKAFVAGAGLTDNA